MKWVLLFFFSGTILFFATLYFKLGAYKEVIIKRPETMSFHLLYKLHKGPYHKINDVITEVEKWAALNDVKCPRTFGEYLDDPKVGDENRLTSNAGCIVEGEVKNPPEGFMYRESETKLYLYAHFSGSPSVSPFVVYPKLEDWLVENRRSQDGPVIEVYTVTGPEDVETEYFFPIK